MFSEALTSIRQIDSDIVSGIKNGRSCVNRAAGSLSSPAPLSLLICHNRAHVYICMLESDWVERQVLVVGFAYIDLVIPLSI